MDQDSFQSLNLTDNAVNRIKNVMTANVDLGSKFRVYVTGGVALDFSMGLN